MHALKSLAPATPAVAACLEKSLRLVDVYTKAKYPEDAVYSPRCIAA
jgi:hypothetical protein